MPSSSAVEARVPTAFADENGVGGIGDQAELLEVGLRLVERRLGVARDVLRGGVEERGERG